MFVRHKDTHFPKKTRDQWGINLAVPKRALVDTKETPVKVQPAMPKIEHNGIASSDSRGDNDSIRVARANPTEECLGFVT